MNEPTPYPALLSPFTLAGKPLRNRVVHASMTTRMAENTRVTERLIRYHANRAQGGAALSRFAEFEALRLAAPLVLDRHRMHPRCERDLSGSLSFHRLAVNNDPGSGWRGR